jgi:hypothetical protein
LLATWGQTVQTTWAFVQRYGVLAYASMTPDWIGNGGVAINGLNNAQLLQRIYTLSV